MSATCGLKRGIVIDIATQRQIFQATW